MTTFRLLLFLLVACGEVSKPSTVDATQIVDTNLTTSDAADDAMPPSARGGSIAPTSGGGTTASSAHRLRVHIGGAQPAGRSSSTGHHLVTGPGAQL